MAVKTNDEIWADNNLDGSPHEPIKQDIRRKMNAIEALATQAGVGAKTYPTKAAMVADLSQPDGTIGVIYADPVDANNFPAVWYWNDAGNVWVLGVDRIGNMEDEVSQSTAAVDGLYLATGVPRPLAWMDLSSYEVVYQASLTSPTTRFTATPTVDGLTIVGLGAMPGVQPVGIKLPHNLLPGESVRLRASYTGGTTTSASGFWIGTDPTTSGPMSTSARLTVYRNGGMLFSTSDANTLDGTRPAVTFLPVGPSPLALNAVVDFLVECQSDSTQLIKIFQAGLQVAGDIVAPATPAGAIILGARIAAGQTAVITQVARREVPGSTLYIHSGAGGTGDGTRGNPLKTLNDIPKAMIDLGLIGRPITITALTDNLYGYLQLKDNLSPRWTLNGIPGGNTSLNGFNFNEVPVWTVVASTSSKVWTTPTKRGLETVSHPNQVFVTNLSWNPRPWYQFPNTCLVQRTTANGGVDMAGDTAGSIANASGVLYLRLPDGLPSADPNAYPTGNFGLVVARTFNILSVVGAPEVNLNNLTLRWTSGSTLTGGGGFGTFNNCVFEWSGYNSPTVQVENGQYTFDGGHTKYSDGDGIGRQTRLDSPSQTGSVLTTRLRNFEISHTGSQAGASGGDGISDHVLDPPFDTYSRSNYLFMENVYIHDCWKCGYVGSDDYLKAHGIRIERCGTEQFAVLGVATDSAVGRTQRAIVSDFRFDPQGLGTTGVRTVYTDGMALCELDLTNGWIGTPAAGGRELEALAATLTVVIGGVPTPQVRDITDNIIRYTNVTTEREPGLVVRNGDGLATGTLTFSTNPANGDTVTIGAVTYTFNTTLGGANSILIGGSSTVTRNNLIGAIMRDPLLIATGYGAATSVHPTVTALPVASGIVAVKAKTPGTGGNAIVTTEVSAALSFGAGTLTGGVAASGTFVPVAAYPLT